MGLLKSLFKLTEAGAKSAFVSSLAIADEIDKNLSPKIDKLTEKIDTITKSLDEQNDIILNELFDNEKEYLKEYKDLISGGEISPREQRLLSKIRQNLDISEERAIEIEALVSKEQLTKEEQEYLKEYREVVSDGEVSDRDKRFLLKFRQVNGISDERAKIIESMV